MATPRKVDTVTKLTDRVSKATSMVFVDYRGLKHKQLEELRKNLKKVSGEFMITKNRLLKRALGPKAAPVDTVLNETTATLFALKDEVAPLKELLKFFKIAALGKTKGGLLGDTPLSEAEVTKLAQLPTRDVLLGSLVRQLQSPIQSLHYGLSWNMNKLVWALNAVKEKKSN